MIKFKIIVILLLPLSMFSQNITGVVYDNTTTAKGIKITNVTKNKKTFTDGKGNFEIEATVNDSIVFHSLFHDTKQIKVTKKHFKEILVIELKKTVNKLDQVLLNSEPKLKTFNTETHNNNFKSQIAEDMKRHPYKYGIQPSSNIDFVKLVSLIGKLFKKKELKDNAIIKVTYKEFDSLFSNNTFFNEKLLLTDLKIPPTYRSLFFDYCDAQHIDRNLLTKQNKFLLLDTLYNCSSEFLIILSDYKKD